MSQQYLLFFIALAVMWSLCCIPPATISAAPAAIAYVVAVEDAQENGVARAYIENLLASPRLMPTRPWRPPDEVGFRCRLLASGEPIRTSESDHESTG
jgi:hypothetical protein